MSDLKEEHEPKGTAVIAWIFLATFAAYYFLNWKFLAALWYWR